MSDSTATGRGRCFWSCRPAESSREAPEDGAARELFEETGYRAKRLEFLFKIAPNATDSTGYAQCYLARDVRLAGEQHLDDTEDLEVVLMDREEVRSFLSQGGFEQAVHVAALYKAVEMGAL